LSPPAGDGSGLVAVTMAHLLPRRLKLWKGIRALGLPARQQEVCLLFAEGLSLPEIAQRLNISRHTAIDHLRNIYSRLGLDQSDRAILRDRLLDQTTVVAGLGAAKQPEASPV
jgi:DNA-binding CsgD family transcriptional regulator